MKKWLKTLIFQEEVEYKVEAVDDGLVISIQVINQNNNDIILARKHLLHFEPLFAAQEKQALFYPDLDYAEGSSEEVILDAEEEMGDEVDLKSDVGDTVEGGDLLQEALVEIKEEENHVEYDYSFLEAADPVLKIEFGPPHAGFGSVWSPQKARKFRHKQQTT